MRARTFVLPADPDPRPELVVEAGDGRGVGHWVPDVKYAVLAKWLDGTSRMRARWPTRVLIDPFCGPGRIRVRGHSETEHGGALIAWRQSQRSGVPFSHVFIGDINGDRLLACRHRLHAFNAPVRMFLGPALETVPRMVAAVPKGSLVLAYVDPYNLSYLAFEIFRELATLRKVDLIVHFSEMDLIRNVDREVMGQRFDLTAPGWREAVDPRQSLASLRRGFLTFWLEQFKALGFVHAEESPLISNSVNRGIYRLIAFSRNPNPNRVWNDVAKGKNEELFP